MEPSVTEALSSNSFSPEQSQATYLLRSLSHQSDSLESDTAMAPVSELYIFESETRDFILSPYVDPQEITCPEYQPLSQTGAKKADPDCDAYVLTCDSEDVVTQCHHEKTMVDYESGMRPPAVDACEAGLMSVNDARQGKAEVIDLTPQSRRSDSPIELWLDACQYLAGEDTEDGDVLDKTDHFVTQGALTDTSDLSFPAGETQVSGYNPDCSDGIGWSGDDTRGWGPPVERWSSVDSWASALSDWTGIIAAPPEDFTAAFTEIGAEIDALTQALAEVHTHIETEASKEGKGQEPAAQGQSQPPMGVQDQDLEAQNIPESPVLSGQSCLSLCLEAAGPELQDREGSQSVESLCDSTPSTRGQKEEVQSSSMGSSGAVVASPGGYGVDAMLGLTSSADLDLSDFGGYVESCETDSNEEDPIVLNIIEDTDLEGQNAPAELIIEEVRSLTVCIFKFRLVFDRWKA